MSCFHELYTTPETCMYCNSQRVYHRPPNILLLFFVIWVKCAGVCGGPNEMGHFHKALPNVKSAYATLQNFPPDLKNLIL